jgi:hypothetical protein
MISFRSIAALLGVVMLASCTKDAVQDIAAPATSGANIKFFNFGINGPGVNFYANEAKITAPAAFASTTNTESTTGTAYGSAGNNGLYSNVAAGPYTFTGRITATTDKDLKVSTLTATLEDKKYYSLYTSGFYNTTAKTMESFLVEDPIPAIDFGVAYVRFVNASPNSSPMTLYAKSQTPGSAEVAVGGLVAYTKAGSFVALPSAVYDLAARVSGSTTNAIARTTVAFVGGRVYTISARGDMTVTSTTAVNRPFLDNTANR